MEGGAIVESQISASSVHYGVLGLQRWGPELARLNNQGIVNAWTSAAHDRNPWIEVRERTALKRRGRAVRAVINAWPVNNRSTCRRRCVWRASSLRAPVEWARLSTSRPSRWRAASMETLTRPTEWRANGGTRLDDFTGISLGSRRLWDRGPILMVKIALHYYIFWKSTHSIIHIYETTSFT